MGLLALVQAGKSTGNIKFVFRNIYMKCLCLMLKIKMQVLIIR